MSAIGQAERETQNRVIALFRDELGYRVLGDWSDRPDNSNIEEDPLTAHLIRSGYKPAQISKALYELRTEAGNPYRSLYDNNKKVYSLLRYGVPVRIEAGRATETVKLVDCGSRDAPRRRDDRRCSARLGHQDRCGRKTNTPRWVARYSSSCTRCSIYASPRTVRASSCSWIASCRTGARREICSIACR